MGTVDADNGFYYNNQEHSDKLLQQLNTFREDATLCDVIFTFEDKDINAHRAVLGACSPYFKCMFTSGMKETLSASVPILGVQSGIFEKLVEYCYTSTLHIEHDNVRDLHCAANLYDFKEVREACERYLLGRISLCSCLSVSVYAQKHGCQELMEGADAFARTHFLKIVRTSDFLELEDTHIIRLIAHDELRVSSEIEVFNAIVTWVKHDLASRRSALPKILEHVRLGTMSPKLLLDCVQTESLVVENEDCKTMLEEITAYHLLPERRCELASVRTRPRKCVPNCLYAIGGESQEGIKLASVERYDTTLKTWSRVSDLKIGRSSVGATSCNGVVYVGGGFDGSKFLNSVEKYTPYENEWTFVAPLTCPRSCMGMVCLDDYVYAIGGRLEDTRLATVERYDSHRDKWFTASRMATSRSAAGVSVVDGCIYVAGGYDGYFDLNTVERYDPRTDKWCQVAPMNKSRSLTAAVTINGLIYVPGGQILMTLLDYVECYDPRNNTWHHMSPLLSSRYGFGGTAIGQQIYVAGGCDGSHRLDSVELYDPVLNTWTSTSHMSVQRHSLGVTCL